MQVLRFAMRTEKRPRKELRPLHGRSAAFDCAVSWAVAAGNFGSPDMRHHLQIAQRSWYPIGPQWPAMARHDAQRPAATRKDTSWHGMSQNDISHRPFFPAKCAQKARNGHRN